MRFFDGVATDASGDTQINLTRFHDTGVYMAVDVTTIGLNGRTRGAWKTAISISISCVR